MARLETLPREVLGNIISRVSDDRLDLVCCALVCRSISLIATQFLYASVDLTLVDEYTEEPPTISTKRQLQFLRSIAESPSLGALVKIFKNGNILGQNSDDATWEAESFDMIDVLALNMRNLLKVEFTANPLAAQVITHLPSYHNLRHLTIDGLDPEQQIWDKFPTALRTLRWEIPPVFMMNESAWHPWDKAQFLINVVESTCADLESLDIALASSDWRSRPRAELRPVAPHIMAQYRTSEALSPGLAKLHHFGLIHTYQRVKDRTQQQYTEFVRRHRRSLTSLSIPVDDWSEKNTFDFAQGVCNLLPGLKDLTLVQTPGFGFRAHLSQRNYFQAFIQSLSSLDIPIEKLSIENIGSSFSSAEGMIFNGLTNLKVLRIGDAENGDGPHAEDGRINIANYREAIWDFIRALPISLEEVYIDINSRDLTLDEDEDFNPLCDLTEKTDIFDGYLHTLEIQLWCDNLDGGVGIIPEKAVFYRRLPSTQRSIDIKKSAREIWISRLDSAYQEDYPTVVKSRELIELSPENVTKQDAEEQWCSGYELENTYEEVDRSWPGWKHEVESYPMFRRTR